MPGGRQCLGPAGPCLGPMPCQPFPRHRHRHSDKTFPPRGGNLSVGVPQADLARFGPIKPDVYSICAVGGHFQPDTAYLSAAFLRISRIPLQSLAFPHFAHFACQNVAGRPIYGEALTFHDNLMRYPGTVCDALPHRINTFILHYTQNGRSNGLPSFKGK